ncbi:hypothetical protein NLC93_02455, partial [Candidatus Aminicenantes bacterium AC-335-G13]|nr:hypothetical protein [Candidatus Aminicenantes bacterium AC-335-G13]
VLFYLNWKLTFISISIPPLFNFDLGRKRIRKLINNNFKDKTCILISHRIWNIPKLKIYCNEKIYKVEKRHSLNLTIFDHKVKI